MNVIETACARISYHKSHSKNNTLRFYNRIHFTTIMPNSPHPEGQENTAHVCPYEAFIIER